MPPGHEPQSHRGSPQRRTRGIRSRRPSLRIHAAPHSSPLSRRPASPPGSNFHFQKTGEFVNLCCQFGRKGEGGWRASCGRGRPQQGAALLANPGRSTAEPFSGPRVLFPGPWQVPGALGCESHRMDDQPAENPPAGGTEPKKLKDTSRSKSKRSFTQSAPNEVCMPVPTPPHPPLAHRMQVEQSLNTVVAVGRYGGLEWTLEVVGTGELGSGQRIPATGDESRCAG
jgi:hypothetical protein